ncbi:MAG: ferric reductase-like transmembrane domain-containing protein [Opitutus sp.]
MNPPTFPHSKAEISDKVARPVMPRRILHGAVWILLYVALVAFPVVVLLAGRLPKGGGYGWDFAMALGFGGLAMLGLQSVLTARFRRATAPFGIDIIYYFHRWAAVAGVGLVLAHYLILKVRYPAALGSMVPWRAPWPMTAGRTALILFAILLISSLWRKTFRLEYDRWRIVHAVLAVAAVVLAIAHIWGVNYYTAAAWKGGVWGAYTALWVLVVGYVRLARPLTLLRRPYSVVDVRKERGRSWTVTVRPEAHGGFRFRPGQFAWLTLRQSPFSAKEHPFSISSSAESSALLQFTIKELGDFTRTIGQVKAGERAYVDGPHGVFTTDYYPDAPSLVFVAGGIGIAPIMSILRTLADRGDPRPMRLIYGNRRWDNVVFREAIDEIASRIHLKVVHVLEEPPTDWKGLQGVLNESVMRTALAGSLEGTVFFVCGPKPMSDSVQRTLGKLGVPMRQVHCELFDMA